MSPDINRGPTSRVESDLQAQARSITELTKAVSEVQRTLAVMENDNEHRDEKIKSILSLGRTVLIAVITLAISAIFAYFAAGGFRVPPSS